MKARIQSSARIQMDFSATGWYNQKKDASKKNGDSLTTTDSATSACMICKDSTGKIIKSVENFL